jgi:hypothetical protein
MNVPLDNKSNTLVVRDRPAELERAEEAGMFSDVRPVEQLMCLTEGL